MYAKPCRSFAVIFVRVGDVFFFIFHHHRHYFRSLRHCVCVFFVWSYALNQTEDEANATNDAKAFHPISTEEEAEQNSEGKMKMVHFPLKHTISRARARVSMCCVNDNDGVSITLDVHVYLRDGWIMDEMLGGWHRRQVVSRVKCVATRTFSEAVNGKVYTHTHTDVRADGDGEICFYIGIYWYTLYIQQDTYTYTNVTYSIAILTTTAVGELVVVPVRFCVLLRKSARF